MQNADEKKSQPPLSYSSKRKRRDAVQLSFEEHTALLSEIEALSKPLLKNKKFR
ncbi:MAG: hypothetical protein RLZZ196_1479 [Bacteroidota bacterium]|jgi:hypothetical protein